MARTKQTACRSTASEAPPTQAAANQAAYRGKCVETMAASNRLHHAKWYAHEHFEGTGPRDDIDFDDVALACQERIAGEVEANPALDECDFDAMGSLNPYERWACGYVLGAKDQDVVDFEEEKEREAEEQDAREKADRDELEEAEARAEEADEADETDETGDSMSVSMAVARIHAPLAPSAREPDDDDDFDGYSKEQLVSLCRHMAKGHKKMRIGYEALTHTVHELQRTVTSMSTTTAQRFEQQDRQRRTDALRTQRLEADAELGRKRHDWVEARLMQADAGAAADGVAPATIYHPRELDSKQAMRDAKPTPVQVLRLVHGMRAAFKVPDSEMREHIADLLGLCDAPFTKAALPFERRSLRQAFLFKELSIDYWAFANDPPKNRPAFWALYQYVLMGKSYNMLKTALPVGYKPGWAGRWIRTLSNDGEVPFHGAPPDLCTAPPTLVRAPSESALELASPPTRAGARSSGVSPLFGSVRLDASLSSSSSASSPRSGRPGSAASSQSSRSPVPHASRPASAAAPTKRARDKACAPTPTSAPMAPPPVPTPRRSPLGSLRPDPDCDSADDSD